MRKSKNERKKNKNETCLRLSLKPPYCIHLYIHETTNVQSIRNIHKRESQKVQYDPKSEISQNCAIKIP